MPNVKSKKHNIAFRSTDFTLNDCANASTVHNKFKKSGKMLQQPVDWDWDENVDDDIDLVEIENENGQKICVAQRVIAPEKRNHQYCDNGADLKEQGAEYPIDIWFQISKYIAPEDVGRFAGICRTTLSVTRSANFWFHMYKKYYKNTPDIPERLQPDHMKLRYGLRLCVIRFLYLVYVPFVIQAHVSNFYTPKALLKRRCSSFWYKKPKNHWIFFFKMKLVNHTITRSRHVESYKRSIFDILDDVMANPEDDCKILRVYCEGFHDAPAVMGMILNIIYTKVAPDMRHNNLFLGFSAKLQNNIKMQEHNMTLVNIFKMEVLDWWHPHYPHSDSLLPSSLISNSSKYIGPIDF